MAFKVMYMTYYGFVLSQDEFNELAQRIRDKIDPDGSLTANACNFSIVYGRLKMPVPSNKVQTCGLHQIDDAWHPEVAISTSMDPGSKKKDEIVRRLIAFQIKYTDDKPDGLQVGFDESEISSIGLNDTVEWMESFGFSKDTLKRAAVSADYIWPGQPTMVDPLTGATCWGRFGGKERVDPNESTSDSDKRQRAVNF
ncbi:hypothetical protein SCHPADRAFT_924688 [Schizopora paradoxa]|uniref:Uncharacterized protein n=1 Tax=Schizopora paradoxa TaxID=27342 RepID=A0A0H2S442_9AGAM|nr:hypothetical protein SCHPADRAFT_924688 [Schizopora paradoxa]